MTSASRIAAVTGADSTIVQALFADVIAQWRHAGIAVVAVLAEMNALSNSTCSAGFLRDMASGAAYSIHLDEAPRDTSCHLDAGGVDAACAAVLPQIKAGDLVVLSKFGKLEAMGRGLFAAFDAARIAGRPVLTTVSPKHYEAWRNFAPDAAALPATATTLQDWWRSQPHSHSIVPGGLDVTS
jgi:hypothetical protein